jgi:hypothetical protein
MNNFHSRLWPEPKAKMGNIKLRGFFGRIKQANHAHLVSLGSKAD